MVIHPPANPRCSYCSVNGHHSRDCLRLHREVRKAVAEAEMAWIQQRPRKVPVEVRRTRTVRLPDGRAFQSKSVR